MAWRRRLPARRPLALSPAWRHARLPNLIASDLAVAIIVVFSTVFVVVAVLGLHIWGAIQDGREEKESAARRRRRAGG